MCTCAMPKFLYKIKRFCKNDTSLEEGFNRHRRFPVYDCIPEARIFHQTYWNLPSSRLVPILYLTPSSLDPTTHFVIFNSAPAPCFCSGVMRRAVMQHTRTVAPSMADVLPSLPNFDAEDPFHLGIPWNPSSPPTSVAGAPGVSATGAATSVPAIASTAGAAGTAGSAVGGVGEGYVDSTPLSLAPVVGGGNAPLYGAPGQVAAPDAGLGLGVFVGSGAAAGVAVSGQAAAAAHGDGVVLGSGGGVDGGVNGGGGGYYQVAGGASAEEAVLSGVVGAGDGADEKTGGRGGAGEETAGGEQEVAAGLQSGCQLPLPALSEQGIGVPEHPGAVETGGVSVTGGEGDAAAAAVAVTIKRDMEADGGQALGPRAECEVKCEITERGMCV